MISWITVVLIVLIVVLAIATFLLWGGLSMAMKEHHKAEATIEGLLEAIAQTMDEGEALKITVGENGVKTERVSEDEARAATAEVPVGAISS
jgi:branched-subunit amino acid permease